MKDFFRRHSKNLAKANIACVDVQKNIFISDFHFMILGKAVSVARCKIPTFKLLLLLWHLKAWLML